MKPVTAEEVTLFALSVVNKSPGMFDVELGLDLVVPIGLNRVLDFVDESMGAFVVVSLKVQQASVSNIHMHHKRAKTETNNNHIQY